MRVVRIATDAGACGFVAAGLLALIFGVFNIVQGGHINSK
jgi:hypothetical protein